MRILATCAVAGLLLCGCASHNYISREVHSIRVIEAESRGYDEGFRDGYKAGWERGIKAGKAKGIIEGIIVERLRIKEEIKPLLEAAEIEGRKKQLEEIAGKLEEIFQK